MEHEKTERPSYMRPSIILQILSIILISANLYLNWPYPKLEVGLYETTGIRWTWEFIITPQMRQAPENLTINMSQAISYAEANMSFIIYNSGKGSAHGVRVKLSGLNVCEIISGYVFSGEPVQANFLTKMKSPYSEYYRGLLGAGEAFSVIFCIKIYADDELTLEVTSENAGKITKPITIHGSR